MVVPRETEIGLGEARHRVLLRAFGGVAVFAGDGCWYPHANETDNH
jgi:hypothetical protein